MNDTKWRAVLAILLLCAVHAAVASPPAPPFRDGTYIGMEPMPNFDPEERGAHWFHQNKLTIKGDTVTLDKSPVWFKNGREYYSASDGGFFTYRGTVSFTDGHWQMELLLTESAYVKVQVDKDGKPIPPLPKQFTITKTKNGSLIVDKITYRRSKSPQNP